MSSEDREIEGEGRREGREKKREERRRDRLLCSRNETKIMEALGGRNESKNEDKEGTQQPTSHNRSEIKKEESSPVGILNLASSKPLDEQLISSYWLADLPKTVLAIKGVAKGEGAQKITNSKSNNIILIQDCDSAEVIYNYRFNIFDKGKFTLGDCGTEPALFSPLFCQLC